MNEQFWNDGWCVGEKQEEKEREEKEEEEGELQLSNCPWQVHLGQEHLPWILLKNLVVPTIYTSRQSHGSIFCRIFEKVHLRGSYYKEDTGQWPKDHHLKAKTAHSLSHLHLMHQSQLLCRCTVQRYCPSSVTHISNLMDHPAQYTGNQSIGNRYLVNEWLW